MDEYSSYLKFKKNIWSSYERDTA